MDLAIAHPPRWLEGLRLLLEYGADSTLLRNGSYPFFYFRIYHMFYFDWFITSALHVVCSNPEENEPYPENLEAIRILLEFGAIPYLYDLVNTL